MQYLRWWLCLFVVVNGETAILLTAERYGHDCMALSEILRYQTSVSVLCQTGGFIILQAIESGLFTRMEILVASGVVYAVTWICLGVALTHLPTEDCPLVPVVWVLVGLALTKGLVWLWHAYRECRQRLMPPPQRDHGRILEHVERVERAEHCFCMDPESANQAVLLPCVPMCSTKAV